MSSHRFAAAFHIINLFMLMIVYMLSSDRAAFAVASKWVHGGCQHGDGIPMAVSCLQRSSLRCRRPALEAIQYGHPYKDNSNYDDQVLLTVESIL